MMELADCVHGTRVRISDKFGHILDSLDAVIVSAEPEAERAVRAAHDWTRDRDSAWYPDGPYPHGKVFVCLDGGDGRECYIDAHDLTRLRTPMPDTGRHAPREHEPGCECLEFGCQVGKPSQAAPALPPSPAQPAASRSGKTGRRGSTPAGSCGVTSTWPGQQVGGRDVAGGAG